MWLRISCICSTLLQSPRYLNTRTDVFKNLPKVVCVVCWNDLAFLSNGFPWEIVILDTVFVTFSCVDVVLHGYFMDSTWISAFPYKISTGFFNFYNHCLLLDDSKLRIKDSLSPPRSFQYIYKKKNPRKWWGYQPVWCAGPITHFFDWYLSLWKKVRKSFESI